MSVSKAVAENLRRLGLILLAAGLIGGFLQNEVGYGPAIYATVSGVGLAIVGYWLHNSKEEQP